MTSALALPPGTLVRTRDAVPPGRRGLGCFGAAAPRLAPRNGATGPMPAVARPAAWSTSV